MAEVDEGWQRKLDPPTYSILLFRQLSKPSGRGLSERYGLAGTTI